MTAALDADVLIGALDRSDGNHARARALFEEWRSDGQRRLISVINLSEVLVAPSRDRRRLQQARESIVALGAGVFHATEPIVVEAAHLRARHPVSLPDAYCLATAKHLRARVASFDEKVRRAAGREQLETAWEPPAACPDHR